jgi:transposase-like protein
MAIINLNAAAYQYIEQRDKKQGSKRCPHCFAFWTEKNGEKVCSKPKTKRCKK